MTPAEVRELLSDHEAFDAALSAWRDKPARWSHTRLANYVRCPLSFFMAYVLGLEGQPSPALLRGQMVHTFAEDYAHECYRRGRSRMYRWGREELASYPPDVREVGNDFLETTEFNWDLIVADGQSVERAFEVELPDDLGLFRGRCDLVQYNEFADQVIVTDYKSGRGPTEQPEQCPAQLACYAWAMQEEFGVASVMAIYRYLANQVTHEWELWAPEPAWACSVVRRIQADDRFEPTPSQRACGWCGVRHLCPVRSDDPICYPAEEDDAAELWEEWCVLKARERQCKSAVRDFVDAHCLEALAAVPDRPGYYPSDPREPTPRDVTGDPLTVVQVVAQALGVEAAQGLIDGRRLGEALEALDREGFGDVAVVLGEGEGEEEEAEAVNAADTLLAETSERQEALHWQDRAPDWWRRLKLREAAAEAKSRQAPDMSGAEEYTPEPPADPHAEERKRLFDRARKLSGISEHRMSKLDVPLTGHRLQENLEELNLSESDARVVREALVTAETPTVADYREAWAQVATWREAGELAGAVYDALCAAAGIDSTEPSCEAHGKQEEATEDAQDPFQALATGEGTFACPVCGREWDEQAAAYECCVGGGDEGEQERML